jgi:hypothetical protein
MYMDIYTYIYTYINASMYIYIYKQILVKWMELASIDKEKWGKLMPITVDHIRLKDSKVSVYVYICMYIYVYEYECINMYEYI